MYDCCLLQCLLLGVAVAWQRRRRHCDGGATATAHNSEPLKKPCSSSAHGEKTSYYQEEVVNGQGPPHELRLAPRPVGVARLAAITLSNYIVCVRCITYKR